MMKMKRRIACCLALALLCAAATAAADWDGDAWMGMYEAFESAYENQAMPDSDLLPELPEQEPAPAAPYDSVTQPNLQGRWVHRYRYPDNGVSVEEVFTVNGDRARIECYENGERAVFWNGEGSLAIEDRSYRGVCPAVSVCQDNGGDDSLPFCAIYIRWVKEDSFFDGIALDEWVREAAPDPWEQYLYDTVSLDALQGVWYGEYEDEAGWYQDVLSIDGDSATLFETLDGKPCSVWNGAGTASIEMAEYDENRFWPELIISLETGAGAGIRAGIFVSRVDGDRFYDPVFQRWFVRIFPDEEEDWAEGNMVFTVYQGGSVRKIDGGYAFAPYETEGELILDDNTELVYPELLDSWEEGDGAVEWMDRLVGLEPEGMGPAGVYDVDVTGDHIDRVYGLYWWD